MEPLIDPPVPYLGEIKGGFTLGKMVRIQGFASPVGERFDINFQTTANTDPRDDVGLHISVRLLEGYIARNSIKGGAWGEGQRNGDLPIQPGQKYEIIVLSDHVDFKVAINGKHFCEFPQRIPVSSITHLSIDGDTSLSLISFESVNLPNQNMQVPTAPAQSNQNFGSPMGPAQYGPPSDQAYGPPGGFADQQGPLGGGYRAPMQGYGPPPGYGPSTQFGPQGYGPPPPPGSEENKSSGLDNFLETAGPMIAGVISSGVADKLLTSISGGGANSPQPHPANQQQQAQPSQQNNQTSMQQQPQQSGGGSDVLSGIGSLLSTLVSPQNPNQQTYNQQKQFTQPDPPLHHPQTSEQSSGNNNILGGIGSLLSNLATPQNSNQQGNQKQQPLPPPKQQGSSSHEQNVPDYLGTIGSLISNYAISQNQQKSDVPPQPNTSQQSYPTPHIPQQNTNQHPPLHHQQETPDYLGTIGSLISNYANTQNQQKSDTQPQSVPQYQVPAQNSGGVDVLGGISSLLSNLSTTNNPNEQQPLSKPQHPTPHTQAVSAIYPQLPNDANSQNSQQQPPQQYQQQSADTGALGGLGSLLSSFSAPGQPSNVGGHGSVGNMGAVGSLLTTFAGQMLQPQNRSGQHQ